MRKTWTEIAWNDYLYWQQHDKKMVARINRLVQDIERSGHQGIGKPEPLRANLSGWWSRRIDHTHRLVYRISEDAIIISACRIHYTGAP